MLDRPGIGIEAIMMLFGTRAHEGQTANALTYLGATLVFEAITSIRELVRSLASG